MFESLHTIGVLVEIYFRSRRLLRKAWKKTEEERWKDLYGFLQPVSARLMEATGCRIVYHGVENLPEKKPGDKGYLLAGNHQSYLDIPVLLTEMDSPTSFVAKEELSKVILVNDMISASGGLYMDTHNIRQGIQVIHKASENLQRGLNMVIFPEGSRSETGEIGEFKNGSLRAATMCGADVVPFRIDNLRPVLEGNGRAKITPKQVDVYFGEPIHTAGMPREEVRNLAEKLRQIVIDLK